METVEAYIGIYLIVALALTAAALIVLPLLVAGSNALTSRNIANEGAWFGFKEMYGRGLLWTIALAAVLWVLIGIAVFVIRTLVA